MAQTFVSLLVHVVFSTKNRADLITPEIEPELFAYMSGILNNHESRSLAINGTANHIHMLISQSKKIALSDLIAEVKKSSSKWIKTKSAKFVDFYWQDGYGAFSIGQSNVAALKQYIARQKDRHRRGSFEQEFIKLLKKYEVEYDEKYIWE